MGNKMAWYFMVAIMASIAVKFLYDGNTDKNNDIISRIKIDSVSKHYGRINDSLKLIMAQNDSANRAIIDSIRSSKPSVVKDIVIGFVSKGKHVTGPIPGANSPKFIDTTAVDSVCYTVDQNIDIAEKLANCSNNEANSDIKLEISANETKEAADTCGIVTASKDVEIKGLKKEIIKFKVIAAITCTVGALIAFFAISR